MATPTTGLPSRSRQTSAAGRALLPAPDSGGAENSGGLGAEQVVQARHPIRFSSLMERARVGAVRRHVAGQRGRGASFQPDQKRISSAKASTSAAAGRRLHHPLRRRRRLRLAARARPRNARTRRALRPRHQGGCREILWRGVCAGLAQARHQGDPIAPRQHEAAGPAA